MILHPDLRALRADDTPQRHAQTTLQAALAGWNGATMTEVTRDLDRFAKGAGLGACPALDALFTPGDSAPRLVQDFARAMAAAMADAPLGHVPLRHFTNGTTSTLLLAGAGNVTLSLTAVDGAGLAARPRAMTVDFGPTETWEHVLAGVAAAEWIEARETSARHTTLARSPLALAPGQIVVRDGRREAMQLRGVSRCLVTLRLQRRHANGEPMREYAFDDGRLVHQAAGDPAESRTELMIALLGRMGRTDAAPLIATVAREEGGAALRWQALRECLALDTRAGFETLAGIARTPGDPLADAAGALRAQLLAAHPQLESIELCPA